MRGTDQVTATVTVCFAAHYARSAQVNLVRAQNVFFTRSGCILSCKGAADASDRPARTAHDTMLSDANASRSQDPSCGVARLLGHLLRLEDRSFRTLTLLRHFDYRLQPTSRLYCEPLRLCHLRSLWEFTSPLFHHMHDTDRKIHLGALL